MVHPMDLSIILFSMDSLNVPLQLLMPTMEHLPSKSLPLFKLIPLLLDVPLLMMMYVISIYSSLNQSIYLSIFLSPPDSIAINHFVFISPSSPVQANNSDKDKDSKGKGSNKAAAIAAPIVVILVVGIVVALGALYWFKYRGKTHSSKGDDIKLEKVQSNRY